jgi:hypothetical protein
MSITDWMGVPLVTLITIIAQAYGLPPESMVALAQAESGLDPNAVGDNGQSIGLFQIQGPGSEYETYQTLANWSGLYANPDLTDPVANTIMACTAHARGYAHWWHGWANVPDDLRPGAYNKMWRYASPAQREALGAR